jgi:nucleotide-binding universal stress UspA family protein
VKFAYGPGPARSLGICHDANEGRVPQADGHQSQTQYTHPMALLERILVATDFSPASRLAANRAAQLASQYHADLLLIHAAPDWKLFSRWTCASESHHTALTAHAQEALRAEINRLASEFGIHARSAIQLGRASRVIAQTAAEYRPNLIVAGARGEHQPMISPEAFGGTTLKLLLHTEYPLLLVRGWDPKPYRVSIAAVHDTCDISRRVVLWASSLVGSGDCHVMHAYDVPYFERTRASGVSDASIKECILATESTAHRIVSDVSTAAAPAAHMHSHVVRGNPLGCLVTQIASHQPTLVALGRQEANAAESDEPFGTEGLRMAYHCPVDTLVVP